MRFCDSTRARQIGWALKTVMVKEITREGKRLWELVADFMGRYAYSPVKPKYDRYNRALVFVYEVEGSNRKEFKDNVKILQDLLEDNGLPRGDFSFVRIAYHKNVVYSRYELSFDNGENFGKRT